jgi:hypothetical protein
VENNDNLLGKTLAGLDNIKNREQEELRKLCETPDTYRVAQALADGLLAGLTYMCNFDQAVGHNGTVTPIQEVIARVAEELEKEFYRMTGRRYINESYRQLVWNRDAPKRLLDKIMRGASGSDGAGAGE